jgi:hypothetical protein
MAEGCVRDLTHDSFGHWGDDLQILFDTGLNPTNCCRQSQSLVLDL